MMKQYTKQPLIKKIENTLNNYLPLLQKKYHVSKIVGVGYCGNPHERFSKNTLISVTVQLSKQIGFDQFIQFEQYLKNLLKKDVVLILSDSYPTSLKNFKLSNEKTTSLTKLYLNYSMCITSTHTLIKYLIQQIQKLEQYSKELSYTPFAQWREIILKTLKTLSGMDLNIKALAHSLKHPSFKLPRGIDWPCPKEIKISSPRRNLIKGPIPFLKKFYSRKLKNPA